MSHRVPRSLRAGPHVPLGWLGTAGVVLLVYLVVVRGGELLLGTPNATVPMAVLATVIVALTIDRVQHRCEHLAAHLLRSSAHSPYDVLRQFSSQVAEADAAARLPWLMVRLLAAGTGAEWAQVWVLVNGRPTLMATWPEDAEADSVPPSMAGTPEQRTGLRSVAVGHGGQVLGLLRVRTRKGHPLTGVEERLFAGLAAQAGLALHTAQLRAELEVRHRELTSRTAQLRQSRDRLVVTQDGERKRLERDIHDGAQQELVALTVNLRLAQTLADRSPQRASELLDEQGRAVAEAIDTLRRLSRGSRPRALDEGGLVEALTLAASTSPLPVRLDLEDVGRLSHGVEAAVYFCCLEAMQNAAKHANASGIRVKLSARDETLELVVTDDGSGIEPGTPAGVGLGNMRSRLGAVGGTLHVDSPSGQGTTVTAVVPAVRAPARRAG
ncbi:MAG TPA: sensor histidine kinase [Nocardioidaceae bacterium]|nr:sensor histidine kinase [Nocardioidaceae bacterium]